MSRQVINGLVHKSEEVLIADSFKSRLKAEIEDMIFNFKEVLAIEKEIERDKKRKYKKYFKNEDEDGNFVMELPEIPAINLRTILKENNLTDLELFNLTYLTAMDLINEDFLKLLKKDCIKFHERVVANLPLDSEKVVKGVKYYPSVKYITEEIRLLTDWVRFDEF